MWLGRRNFVNRLTSSRSLGYAMGDLEYVAVRVAPGGNCA
jgi:hypothetical protein